MFSKSDSVKIFIVVTVTAAVVFLFLSYDTLKKIPNQTNEVNITDSVIRGKYIWESNNCMGCHTLFGEGAYYAPELTKVTVRRSEDFLKIFLKDPISMYPGKRKMVKYNFSDGEIEDLLSFLKWCSEVDLNGFPPLPFLKKHIDIPGVDSVLSSSIPAVFDSLCLTCHSFKGYGTRVAPAPSLDNIGSVRDKSYLEKWLTDPKSVKSDAAMPKFPLSNETILELSEFLSKQK